MEASTPHTSSAWATLQGEHVVIDLSSTFVCLGRLVGEDHRYLILDDADLHDLRDTKTTRELYVVESKRHGIRSNRKQVLIRREEIVGIAKLADVID